MFSLKYNTDKIFFSFLSNIDKLVLNGTKKNIYYFNSELRRAISITEVQAVKKKKGFRQQDLIRSVGLKNKLLFFLIK